MPVTSRTAAAVATAAARSHDAVSRRCISLSSGRTSGRAP
jgi:hypothetical protein